MSILIGGVEYWTYPAATSYNKATGTPSFGALATVTDQAGNELIVRDPGTKAVVSATTSNLGIWPELLVNAPVSVWTTGSGAEETRPSVDNLLLGAQAADSALAAEQAQAAAEAAQVAAENAVGPAGPPGPAICRFIEPRPAQGMPVAWRPTPVAAPSNAPS